MHAYSFLIAFGAGLGGLLFGYEVGIVDQILLMQSFKDYFNIGGSNETEVNGNVASIFLIGCIIGAIAMSFVADLIGRKKSILLGCCSFLVGASIQAGAINIGMLYAGRVIGGSGVGVLSTVVPMFIAESSPAALRGTLTSVFQLMITCGIFVASCINTVIMKRLDGQESEWRTAFSIQIVPGLMLLFTLIFLPETPRFLAKQGFFTEAGNVVSRLRNAPIDSQVVKAEMQEIRQGVERDIAIGQAKWSELLGASMLPRMIMVVLIQAFQQLSGINAIMYYAGSLYQDMGIDAATASTTLVIVNALVNFLATFPALLLVERVGRKRLLVFGAAGMAVCHGLVCLCMWFSLNSNPTSAYAAITFIYLYICFFASTWGPIVWVVQSEVLPLRVRGKGVGIGTLSNWTFNAIVAKAAPYLAAHLGAYQYLVYGGFSALACLYTLFYVRETKGLTLEELQELFGQRRSANVDEEISIHAKSEDWGINRGNGGNGTLQNAQQK